MSTLYVVATPIGNLEDISLRALRVLKEVALIACEDTRRTKILLDRYQITTSLVSYHQHSKLTKIDWLVSQLKAGKNIALVSDAGTPGINDPGGVLIAAAIQANSSKIQTGLTHRLSSTPEVNGYHLWGVPEAVRKSCQIVPIPGANAGVTLLSVSGWPVDRYLFLGYLPKKKGRQTMLSQLAAITWPMVIYESPERLVRTLTDLLAVLGDRPVVIGRELTKQFEEVWRGTLVAAVTHWRQKRPRGEIVLLVGSVDR